MSKLAKYFALDLRSLALARIGLGLILIADLLARWPNLEVHYTDSGLLPRAILALQPDAHAHSIYMLGGGAAFVRFLFIISLCSALSVAVGYRTRAATVVSWLLLVSLQNRNELLLDVGDQYLRVLVLWGALLPWGERYSVDRWLRPREIPNRVLSVATLGFSLQIFLVYFIAGSSKTGAVWANGAALANILGRNQNTPLSHALLQYPSALAWLTFAVPYLECLGAIAWFSPIWTARVRRFSLGGFILLHLGIALTLNLGLFPFICLPPLIALIPVPNHTGVLKLRNRTVDLLAAVLIAFTIVCSIIGIPRFSFRPPALITTIADELRLDQSWVLYTNPGRRDGWIVVAGTRPDNSRVNLFDKTGEPLSYEKPPLTALFFSDQRWRMYLRQLTRDEYKQYREAYGDYLCRMWNGTHADDRVVSTELILMDEVPVGKALAPAVPRTIFSHICAP